MVAESSLEFHRDLKLPQYARAGVRETLAGGSLRRKDIERHTEPSEQGYPQLDRYQRSLAMHSLAIPSQEHTLDEVLG